MTKVLVLYYSMYGHVETLAKTVAEGCAQRRWRRSRHPPRPRADARRRGSQSGPKLDQAAPIGTVAELPNYDAIIFGTPTRFGNMCSQMRNFLDQTGKLWLSGGLIGKVGSVFTSTGTQHGGQETTITSFHSTLLHHGMIIVGVPYSCQEIMNMSEITGGSPYGASTLAGGDGSRQPSENELKIARFQGRHVAEIAKKQSR